jgi:glycosyltransferase involved in cell wall biosynthesis
VWQDLGDRADVRLVVAGAAGHDWTSYPEIAREAYAAQDFSAILGRWRSDPRVTIGPVPREALLDDVYWEADIYLHLARMETFGYSVLEAMARALPVIATGINALPEMVRHEETGFVIVTSQFDINSDAWRTHVANEATRHVRRLIDDPGLRDRLGAAGRARVQQAFSVEHRRRVLDRAYRDALSGIRRDPATDTAARHFHSGSVR